MKFIFCISLLTITVTYLNAQTGFSTVDNQTISMDALNGKRAVIIILPVENDTAIVHQLVNFQNKFGDSVKLIGLICLNTCNVSSQRINSDYRDAIGAGVLITTGTSAADSSSERESVLKWLSDKSNSNRSSEPGIIETKYFLSKGGRMYARLGRDSRLDSKIAENIVRMNVPGEN